MSTTKKKNEAVAKVPATKKNGKIEMVEVFTTTYGYYRYWVKNILAEGGVSNPHFVFSKAFLKFPFFTSVLIIKLTKYGLNN